MKPLGDLVEYLVISPSSLPPIDVMNLSLFSPRLSLEKGSPIKASDAQRNVDIEGLSAEDLEYNYDKKGLADLRRRMKDAMANYQGRIRNSALPTA